MTALAGFSQDETDLLVSLPYKVGIWVSYSDDADGDEDDARELKSLRHCLAGIAKLHAGDTLIAEIMKECLEQKTLWDGWAEDCFNAANDAAKAVKMIKAKAPEKTARRFGEALMQVASAVAQAYGEFGEFDEAEGEGIFAKIIGGFAGLAPGDKNHPMNVSAAEDSALSELAAAVKI